MKLIIDVTSKCNLHCKHCGNSNLIHSDDIDIVEKIRQLKYKIDEVDLLGGEPLLYSYIYQLLDYFEETGTRVNIITNGQFDFELCDKLLQYKCINNLSVSIEGNEHENDLIRGKGSFNRAISFVSYLLLNRENMNINIGFNMTINRYNFKELDLSYLINTGIDYIHLNRLLDSGRASGSDLVIDFSEYLDGIEKVCSKYSELVKKGYLLFDFSNPNLIDYLNIKYNTELNYRNESCGAGKNVFYMDNLGHIHPCRGILDAVDINKNVIGFYSKMIETTKKKDNDYCIDCSYNEQCFECPIKREERFLECKIIMNRLTIFLTDMLGKEYKVSNDIVMYSVNEEFKFYDVSTNQTISVPKEYMKLFTESIIRCENNLPINMLI